jgi:hypothetical protein
MNKSIFLALVVDATLAAVVAGNASQNANRSGGTK